MKIEHILYVTPEEADELVKRSGAKNVNELKEFITKEFEMKTDFCVRMRPDSDDFDMLIIDYDDKIDNKVALWEEFSVNDPRDNLPT